MKQILGWIVAGVCGGLIVLAGNFFLEPAASQAAITPTPTRAVNWAPRPIPASALDFATAAERVMPTVVHIRVLSKFPEQPGSRFPVPWGEDFFGFGRPRGPQEGTGSGVIYTADGHIITNNHVVENASEIEVTLFDNREYKAKLVGADKKSDLAVLKIDSKDLPTLELGDADKARVGEWVLAVGNPFDLTSTVTAGIISAKGRNIQMLPGQDAIESFLQTDAAVNPGNSGGALVDAEGRLLGINTAIATRNGSFQGYSFAIPINLAKRIVDDIMDFGSYQRAFLGVEISELDSEYARELGVSVVQGVVVEALSDGGSAQYAGLQEKDIIIRANDRAIKYAADIQEIIGRAKVGDVIQMIIIRQGQEMEIPVRLRTQQ
ncbi:MAG: trypsin-like peptidase domain-containing protein [Lewinellaceae bacterium]|nr:trypsin-like peptidase domain-containing protein [Lewinellaceae bacterium]